MTTLRLRRARTARGLRARGLDALFLEPGSDLRYLTGRHFWRSERLIALILTAGGRAHLIRPAFEYDVDAGPDVQVHPWLEHEDPFRLVDRVLSRKVRSIAVGPDTRQWVIERLSRRVAGDEGLLQEMRSIKGPEEIRAIRQACRKTLASFRRLPRLLKPGMTEREVSAALGSGLVQFMENAGTPHAAPGDRRLRRGDWVLVDRGDQVEGYWSDITRTSVFGRPSQGFRVFDALLRKAQQAGIRALRAGATCESVDSAARDVIDSAGLRDAFVHRLGHGIGLDGHEPPYLVQGNRTRLKAGMVVTIEPGIYLPGAFGMRLEDVAMVTLRGGRVLSR